MTVLITGGAGNLACQLTFEMKGFSNQIILMDIAKEPVTHTAENCVYVQGNLNDKEHLRQILQRHRPHSIVHFASLLSGSSEMNRQMAWEVNMDGAFALFELALEFGVERFFFPSSLASYGGKLPSYLTEDTPQWSDGLYGVTKLAIERLGVYYHRQHGLDFRCLRLPVVVSPFSPAGAASSYASRVFVEAVEQRRYTFKVNPHTRASLMYVHDAINGISDLLKAPPEQLTKQVYNVHAISPTAEEIARAVCKRVKDVEIYYEPSEEVDTIVENWPDEIEDTSARRDWGWSPKYGLEAMADDMIVRLTKNH